MRKAWGVFLILFFLCNSWVGAQPFEFAVSMREMSQIDSLPLSPFIFLIPDRGEWGVYHPGENIVLQYGSSRDGYVSIFDYTPDGSVRIIKNNEPIAEGVQRKIYGVVSGPEGTERFLMMLSEEIIPDRLLVEAMRNPSRIEEIIGYPVLLHYCRIQVSAKERELAPSFISFDPVPGEILAGGKLKIRAFLFDEQGNALVNRPIYWEVSQGALDSYQTRTSTSGAAEVWYSAPSVLESTGIVVRANFPGDMVYQAAEGEIYFVVNPEKIQTTVTISPKSFHVAGGEAVDFQAELRDLRGKPVEGRSIQWEASIGGWEEEITYTDSAGMTTNRLYAPKVVGQERVEVKVSFAGAKDLLPSQDYAYGTVSGLEVYAKEGLYFLDFTSGEPYTNFDYLTYWGEVLSGWTINPGYVLSLPDGEFLEVEFSLSRPLSCGALYLWGKAQDEVFLKVFLNDQLVLSGRAVEGMVAPTEVQIIYIADYLELGNNLLRIEVDSLKGVYYLQRLLVVF
ncbi:MAG TPA: hypothetical protein PK844_02245 [Candidatus Atribacteria bacterium]|nr:hypothetical protein [Candidatus Atribacteria bacterium]